MTDFIYHHKMVIVALIILLIGAIGGGIALKEEDYFEENTFLSDASASIKEEESPPIKIEEETEEKENEERTKITVDIKGAVKFPNVYQVYEESRIYEIIAFAGGLTENAYTKNINLSKKVEDEMVIYIYTEEEYEEKITCHVKNEYAGEISEEIETKQSIIQEQKDLEEKNEKISLNNATLEELITLDGIGEAKAKSIIEYRENNQGFKEVEELIMVPGIGQSLYEKIKDRIIL